MTTREDQPAEQQGTRGSKPSSPSASVPLGLAALKIFDVDFELADTRAELCKKIRWIIRIRFVISPAVVALMFITGWQGLTTQQTLTRSALYGTLITGGIALLLNGVYFYALKRPRIELKPFVILQLVVDVLIFSSYVYRSGGVTSPLTFLYILPVIGGAMLVSGGAAVSLAALSSVCFITLSILGATGAIAHISYFVALDRFAHKWPFVVLMMIVNPFAFFTVAGISAFLMRAVRDKTHELERATVSLDRKARLLGMLYDVSRSAVHSRDADAVLDRVGEILVRGLDLDRALIYIAEGDGLSLARELYHPGLSDGRKSTPEVTIPLDPSAGVTAVCALERRPMNIVDPENHPLINRELAARIGINPFAVAPMVFRGEMLGVIGIDRSVTGDRSPTREHADHHAAVIDHDAFQVLIAFADQAAASLAMARLERGR
ncbi:MAG: GAF domain-containing protein [Myxococcales bacterium]|nr:GAF domain-containing protein [Myxococcales bacterium]